MQVLGDDGFNDVNSPKKGSYHEREQKNNNALIKEHELMVLALARILPLPTQLSLSSLHAKAPLAHKYTYLFMEYIYKLLIVNLLLYIHLFL